MAIYCPTREYYYLDVTLRSIRSRARKEARYEAGSIFGHDSDLFFVSTPLQSLKNKDRSAALEVQFEEKLNSINHTDIVTGFWFYGIGKEDRLYQDLWVLDPL